MVELEDCKYAVEGAWRVRLLSEGDALGRWVEGGREWKNGVVGLGRRKGAGEWSGVVDEDTWGGMMVSLEAVKVMKSSGGSKD